jgi:glutathione synthase
MRACFVIVNSVTTLEPSQSTAELLLQLLARGISVGLVNADAVETRPDGSVWARARMAVPTSDTRRLVDALRETTTEPVDLMQAGLVWVRVNPGRGPATAHALLLEQLAHLEDSGVTVLNSPRGLLMARSKLYLSRLPVAARPRTLVTRSAASARDFVASLAGPAVLKPVIGTRGRDVFLVAGATDPNFRQIFDVIARAGPVMVQAFIPEASDGDTRVLLVDGRLLERAGAAALVRRVPSGSDFRSNVHVGGRPAPGVLTPGIRALVDAVGPRLREDGLFLVGLDVIGGVVVEANVFAAGGFSDIEAFTGVDFLGDVVEAALRRAGLS